MPKGKHENHASGSNHHRWNQGRIISPHGYVKVRVGVEHSLADPNGYAYEHILVWVAAGNARPGKNETLHHRNEDKQDNRISNLTLISRADHAREHQPMVKDREVKEIRERYANGEDGTALAAEFGIPFQRVYRYVHGESRRTAGGPIKPGNLRKKRAGRTLDGRTWDEYPKC